MVVWLTEFHSSSCSTCLGLTLTCQVCSGGANALQPKTLNPKPAPKPSPTLTPPITPNPNTAPNPNLVPNSKPTPDHNLAPNPRLDPDPFSTVVVSLSLIHIFEDDPHLYEQ